MKTRHTSINKATENKQGVQKSLEDELEKLKDLLKIGSELKVIWATDISSSLCGEVKKEIIYIYEEEYEKALEALMHEFLDYCLSQAIEPYKEVANRLISIINENAYKQKEKVVQALTKLLTERHVKMANTTSFTLE